MKAFGWVMLALIVISVVIFMMGTDMEVEDNGVVPEVDVSVEEQPEDAPDVDVKTTDMDYDDEEEMEDTSETDMEDAMEDEGEMMDEDMPEELR